MGHARAIGALVAMLVVLEGAALGQTVSSTTGSINGRVADASGGCCRGQRDRL
jgi:hypothetical protein